MPSEWRKCERCRKVLRVSDFPSEDPDSRTCSACLAPPVRKTPVRAARVATRPPRAARTAPARAEAEPAAVPRTPPPVVPGRGDPEVRRARARARAHRELIAAHEPEFAGLLQHTGGRRAAALNALIADHSDEFAGLLESAEIDEKLRR